MTPLTFLLITFFLEHLVHILNFFNTFTNCFFLNCFFSEVASMRLDDAHSLKGSTAAGEREISNNERLSNALSTFFTVEENYFQRQNILISGSPGVCHESYFYVLVAYYYLILHMKFNPRVSHLTFANTVNSSRSQ